MACIVFLLIAPAFALDCNLAPTEALRIVCNQLQRWDTGARKIPATTTVLPPAIPGKSQMAAEFAPIASNVYQCMDIACLCVFFRGSGGSNCVVQGRPVTRAVRKEYRTLSVDERNRLHAAFRTIKNSGEFDRLARIHAQFATSGGAHSGPAFLPWHREYMKRVEIALRQVDPSLALPYWDSSLDQNLPDSKDSAMWVKQNNRFTSITNRPAIRRAVGAQGKLFSEDEIMFTVNNRDISQVLGFSAPQRGCPIQTNFNILEYTHGNPHIYVGGEMLDQSTAANDPVFYLHHSFVDYIWEMFRMTSQSRSARERAYPVDNAQCSSEHHFSNAFMRPFPPMRNADGLSNMYTDNLYTYAPRPSCSMGNNCGSENLFCDRSHGAPRCAAKMKSGANCASFTNGEAACYNGRCVGGRCVAGQAVTQPPITEAKPVVTIPASTCFNEHECCSVWSAKGECNRNYVYMSEWCKASCRICQANYDLNNECLDRHPNCATWARSGECQKNPLWMSENCRSACGKCQLTRAVVCGGGGGGGSVSQNPATATPVTQCQSNPNLCFNEDLCCDTWAAQGECAANAGYMNCNCRVSCRRCQPNFRSGGCIDYHTSCLSWSRSGECQKNKWMLENCRRSCNMCLSSADLQRRCPRRRVARESFLESISM